MPTLKQKKAVDKMLESAGSVGEAMREAGYGPGTVKNPHELTRSKGFKELMKQYGLTEELITKSLVEDIKAKPQKRVEELKLGSKILRMVDEDKESDKPQEVNIIKEQKNITIIVQSAEEQLRKELEG